MIKWLIILMLLIPVVAEAGSARRFFIKACVPPAGNSVTFSTTGDYAWPPAGTCVPTSTITATVKGAGGGGGNSFYGEVGTAGGYSSISTAAVSATAYGGAGGSATIAGTAAAGSFASTGAFTVTGSSTGGGGTGSAPDNVAAAQYGGAGGMIAGTFTAGGSRITVHVGRGGASFDDVPGDDGSVVLSW